MDIVAEDAAELVGGDAADEAAFGAEGGEAGDGVGDRAARALDGRAHGLVKLRRLVRIDQAHEALVEVVLGEKALVAAGNDVDDGVADADHVVGFFSHSVAGPCSSLVCSWRGPVMLRAALASRAGVPIFALPEVQGTNSCSPPQVKPLRSCSRRHSAR